MIGNLISAESKWPAAHMRVIRQPLSEPLLTVWFSYLLFPPKYLSHFPQHNRQQLLPRFALRILAQCVTGQQILQRFIAEKSKGVEKTLRPKSFLNFKSQRHE